MMQLYDLLRAATEDDIQIVRASIRRDELFSINLPPADLLEFFNRMIDELISERTAAEEIDDFTIAGAIARRNGR